MDALGGDSEYSVEQELNLAVDEAWTEIDLEGEGEAETWRLRMAREEQWRACDAETVD